MMEEIWKENDDLNRISASFLFKRSRLNFVKMFVT